ncbi:MAG: rhomboid family intramembrane serine protease [Phycisphaerales bacterium]
MGIYDRDYYDPRHGSGSGGAGLGRISFRPGRLSVTSILIIINVAVFFLDLALPMVDIRDVVERRQDVPRQQFENGVVVDAPRPQGIRQGEAWARPILDPNTGEVLGQERYRTWHALNGYGHFSLLHGFLRLEVWRLVTFQFLHADLTHLFFNMFGLFIFGGMVEQYLGRSRYLSYYLICGISGGLLYLLFAGLASIGVSLPGTLAFTGMGTPLIGASAGVFGVIVACARIAPDMRVMLLIPPIPIKMKWLAYGYVGIAAFNLLSGGTNAGGDAAHLGGAIAGFYFIRKQHLLRDFLDFQLFRGKGKTVRRADRSARSAGGINRRELDRILAKVSESGLHSLTAKEKKTLERASRDARDAE